MYKQRNNEKAITLIALVVTIIVLLVLAGISIATLTGENGVLTQSSKAKEETHIGEELEIVKLSAMGAKDYEAGELTEDKLAEELTKYIGERDVKYTLSKNGDKYEITFLDCGRIYTIDIITGEVKLKGESGTEDVADSNKIIDIVAYQGDGDTYVLTEKGEVRKANRIRGNIFYKVEVDDDSEIITTNGVRKKGNNFFIDNAGKVYTWGYNDFGTLGNGMSYEELDYSNNIICISDIEESPLYEKNIVDVYDANAMIAKDDEGKLYTWGVNSTGQLGDGETEIGDEEYRAMPKCISDIEGSPLNGEDVKISNIYTNEFAIIAKDENGKLYAWGQNRDGMLGDGTTYNRNMPICISDVEGSELKEKNIVDIYWSGAIIARDDDGKLYTWGSNYAGQLGDGTTAAGYGKYRAIPVCISDLEDSVLKGKNIIDVYNTGDFTIVRDNEGSLYTWGYNFYGLLGEGTTQNSYIPICISDVEDSVLNNKNITNVYVVRGIDYYRYTVLAKDIEGNIYTWGNNDAGQLGDGTTEVGEGKYRATPVCISNIEGNALNEKSITDIYIISNGTIMVKDENEKLYTWGSNSSGQLGDGTTEIGEGKYRSTPVCISDLEDNALNRKNIIDVITIDWGYFYEGWAILAKDSEKKLYTWGNNSYGQLGNGKEPEWNDESEEYENQYISEPTCINDIQNSELNGKKVEKIIITVSEFYYGSIYYVTDDGCYELLLMTGGG